MDGLHKLDFFLLRQIIIVFTTFYLLWSKPFFDLTVYFLGYFLWGPHNNFSVIIFIWM